MKKIGVIGLGNMGRGMALSLKRGGLEVRGFDASTEAVSKLAEEGIVPCSSIAQIVRESEVIILSLPTSDIVEAVTLGEGGIAKHAKPGLFVVDTTTAAPTSTRKVAKELNAAGVRFVDAPVSGGPKGAATATMIMVQGGSEEDVVALEPVLAKMSAKRVHVGPVGAGHVTKIVNNLLGGIHLLVASEAVQAAKAAGVDATKLIDALNGGTGRNSATLVNYPTWILNEKFDSGFTMKLMRKDMRLAKNLFDGFGVAGPVSNKALSLWAESEKSIGDSEDFNRIVQLKFEQ